MPSVYNNGNGLGEEYTLKQERDALKLALVSMCIQYLTDHLEGYWGDEDNLREFHHDFMSAGERACDILCEMGLAEPRPTGTTLTKEAFEDWTRGR